MRQNKKLCLILLAVLLTLLLSACSKEETPAVETAVVGEAAPPSIGQSIYAFNGETEEQVEDAVFTGAAQSHFQETLQSRYADPDRVYSSDIRWWLPEASLTDEELLGEIQKLYNAGFRGVELCMQTDADAPDAVYAYGSEMWAHKWKLMINALLDNGMTVGLTSGTNWSTSNVPGLDPDSQAASQVLAMGFTVMEPGTVLSELPRPETQRGQAAFLGAYAYRVVEGKKNVTVAYDSMVDLTADAAITQGTDAYDQRLKWTCPSDGAYAVFAYWAQGAYETAEPAVETCYAINYFDQAGVEALKAFWTGAYLDEPELNEKIAAGDVQLFMDSIELTPVGGITWWAEDIRAAFQARKGYDIMPCLFLIDGLPQGQAVFNPYTAPAKGNHDLADNAALREKIINDWVDVLTQLYEENLLLPLRDWLHGYGITTRAQISYGRSFEITEPSAYVDYPEAENLNQYGQVDIFRLHTAGAKLQNKVLSTETGAMLPINTVTMQQRLMQAYQEYAAGFQRVIWHIWGASANYGEESVWLGNSNAFDHWGDREPSYADMDEMNAHIGRIQQLMQTGKSRTDIGILHNNWNQGLNFNAGVRDAITGMNYMLAHMGVYYRSTALQDNGYTYDYLSPDLLTAEGVYFDEETRTIEPAGYRALLIYQRWLDPDGARLVLDWARKGLPVVVMEGAAVSTPFNDGRDSELAETMAALLLLDNVKSAAIDAQAGFDYFAAVADGYSDGALEALTGLGVYPYAGYMVPNHQLLGQCREDADGSRYLYLYNYCPDNYHSFSHVEAVKNETHGTDCVAELVMDGTWIPYQIHAWTGEVTKLKNYRYADGKTILPVTLSYNDIALLAFEKPGQQELHVTQWDGFPQVEAVTMPDGQSVLRVEESGTYSIHLSDGTSESLSVTVPNSRDITGWTISVETWEPGSEVKRSEEELFGIHTVNATTLTAHQQMTVQVEKLATWDQLEGIGKDISGTGTYTAAFSWDASAADGAYIDFGSLVGTMELWINGVKVGGSDSTNPTKAPADITAGGARPLQSGGVGWMNTKTDIGSYLQDGENSIRIIYSSSIGNAALANNIACNGINLPSWWQLSSKKQNYGPSQAVLIPYVIHPIP